MPHPTLTWTATAPRAVAIAGASSTAAELLVAIKAALDNDATLWETSFYDAATGTLEIKRKASTTPTGEAATARLLLMAGFAPHANAMSSALVGVNTQLYAAASVDANTAGPPVAYTVGAPYASTFIKSVTCLTVTLLQAAESPRVSLMESVDGIAIWLGDTNNRATIIFGKLVIEASTDALMWCILPMGASASNITTMSTWTETNQTCEIPSNSIAAHSPRGIMWNSVLGACRYVGRCINGHGSSAVAFGAAGMPSALLPIPLAESTLATSNTLTFVGFLRQLRWGPAAQHNQTMRDADGDELAIHFGPPLTLTGYGCWFDQAQ